MIKKLYLFFTKLIHFLGGFLTAYSTEFSIILPILMFLIFVLYELDEDWHISDNAYEDIRDYAIGLYLYAILRIIFSL
jgi:hypothetical protein